MPGVSLDLIDLELLKELQVDADRSNVELARLVGLSPTATLHDLLTADSAAGTLTIGDLQGGLPDTVTLTDAILAMIPPSALRWEDVPLDDLNLPSLGATPAVAKLYSVPATVIVCAANGVAPNPSTPLPSVLGTTTADPVRTPFSAVDKPIVRSVTSVLPAINPVNPPLAVAAPAVLPMLASRRSVVAPAVPILPMLSA